MGLEDLLERGGLPDQASPIGATLGPLTPQAAATLGLTTRCLVGVGLIDAHAGGPLDGVVLDLGVSSMQLDRAERGFSFQKDGPLDMRMSQDGESAADLVNGADEGVIADVLYHYGEERASRRIARAIEEALRLRFENEALVVFVCDNLRLMSMGKLTAHDFDSLLEQEIYTIEQQKDFVLEKMLLKNRVPFTEFISYKPEKIFVIYTFLAILELLQLSMVTITIGEGFNNFWVEKQETVPSV